MRRVGTGSSPRIRASWIADLERRYAVVVWVGGCDTVPPQR
jgi:membrane carboxypeptidase/penicillin-binding protein PbpC